MEELAHFVARWRSAHQGVSDETLAWLMDGEGQEPQYLSDALQVIAERLEPAPFPSTIEHALWTAAPLLERLHLDDDRLTWSIPDGDHGAYAEALRQILASEGQTA